MSTKTSNRFEQARSLVRDRRPAAHIPEPFGPDSFLVTVVASEDGLSVSDAFSSTTNTALHERLEQADRARRGARTMVEVFESLMRNGPTPEAPAATAATPAAAPTWPAWAVPAPDPTLAAGPEPTWPAWAVPAPAAVAPVEAEIESTSMFGDLTECTDCGGQLRVGALDLDRAVMNLSCIRCGLNHRAEVPGLDPAGAPSASAAG